MTEESAPDPPEGADFTSPRRGSPVRRNALFAQTWTGLVDVDPRVADALLEALEDAGVAAYAEPTTGPRGPYLDTRPPTGPTERMYVDAARRDVAEAILAAELPGLLRELEEPADDDARFAAIVAAWDAEPEAPVPPWPVNEDVATAPPPPPEPERPAWTAVEEDEDDEEPEYDGEHFVPPAPEPLPDVHPVTRWAAIAVAAGVFLLVGLPLFGTTPSSALSVVGALAVIGGVATLVLRMRDAPSVDDGPDDGAVV